MVNVKKYRAGTTREALEKIKMDIGDDAFVLETKQVKAGGFMGLGAKTQIEISAVPSVEPLRARNGKANAPVFPSSNFLNLTEDAPALPRRSKIIPKSKKQDLMSALRSRAESVSVFDRSFQTETRAVSNGVEEGRVDAVEITEAAPKIVHSKGETAVKADDRQIAVSEVAPENLRIRASSRELELLRAEIREIKFSINSFAGNQHFRSLYADAELNKSSAVSRAPYSEAYLELTGMGISSAIAHLLVSEIIPKVIDGTVGVNEIAKASLQDGILSLIKFGEDPLKAEKPGIMAVIGATGVGKTTTIAKLAARIALEERRPVELVTLDTYRIAAVEQLVTYAGIIGAGCHVVRSVLELDGLIRRFPSEATVLIDTTGKNPLDLSDQYEFSNYLQRHTEITKCLAVQATTHPADAIAAIKKFQMYGANCLAITKLDETTRPGATLELIAESGLPLTYLCMGQRVPEDLKVATPESFTSRLFGEAI